MANLKRGSRLLRDFVLNNRNYFNVKRAVTDEEIDLICEFRARGFIEQGTFPQGMITDRDEFDDRESTYLMYAEKNGKVVGTIRLIKSTNENPSLPIDYSVFYHEDKPYSLTELCEAGLLDGKAVTARAQIAGLVLDREYWGGRGIRNGLIPHLFLSLANIAFNEGIPGAIICADPHTTRMYHLYNAKLLYSGKFNFGKKFGEKVLPVDVMYISHSDLVFSFLIPLTEHSESK